MHIITTKQLRENMQQVIADLRHGKSVQLSYRHSVIGVLQPLEPSNRVLRRGSPEAVRSGLQILQETLVPNTGMDTGRSIKEQIAELREKKYRSR